MTTTVWSNLFLAAFFFAMSHRNVLLSCLFLALETQRNFYPFVLIVPCVLILSDDRSGRASRIGKGARVCLVYVAMMLAGVYFGIVMIKNHSFLRATYGFMSVSPNYYRNHVMLIEFIIQLLSRRSAAEYWFVLVFFHRNVWALPDTVPVYVPNERHCLIHSTTDCEASQAAGTASHHSNSAYHNIPIISVCGRCCLLHGSVSIVQAIIKV